MNMLTSSRHGPIRLWDLRNERPVLRYSGHRNTANSFLRARFAVGDSVVVSGSDDGSLHVWQARTGEAQEQLRGHRGAVYRGAWSSKQGLLASCSEDGSLGTWCWAQK